MDTRPEPPVPTLVLIVRLHGDRSGQIRGFVERPRTGAKEPFVGLPAIAEAIERLVGPAAVRTDPDGPLSRA